MTQEGENISNEIPPEKRLAESRQEIGRITRSILDLANERQKVSLEISRNKMLLGETITNPEVEKRLLSESGEYARSIGLDEEFARALVLDLIRFSKVAQSADVYREKIKRFLESRRISTVSVVGAGRMGVWFAKYFRDLSVRTYFYDEKLDRAIVKSEQIGVDVLGDLSKVSETDLVLVSVPISKTPKLVNEVSNAAKRSSRALNVVEISSVKNEMAAAGLLDREFGSDGISLYSIHPLFGGSALPFELNSIIQSCPKDTTFLRGLFPQFTIVTLDQIEHDRLMSLFLTLPHALAFTFADALTHEGKLSEEEIALNSPSYSSMLELSKRVLSENPEVYFEIQSSNPNSKKILSGAMNSLLRLEKAVGNRSEFTAFFEELKSKIEAIERSQTR